MQWLYGSGEGAAGSIQAFHGLADYVRTMRGMSFRCAGCFPSAILTPASTLDAPEFQQCGAKPWAVVLDVDETALQNLGYEYHEATAAGGYDAAVWDRWEKTGADRVAPMPGAVTALRQIRDAGVTIIFNSNRKAANAAATEAALNASGLGPAKHGETLYLSGDDAMGSAKDGRRATIAARWCVVALAGDQLGDFSDLFNARTVSVTERRRAAGSGAFAAKWGNGWFLLPNPVYGPGLRGTLDEVFPADKRWQDPQGGK